MYANLYICMCMCVYYFYIVFGYTSVSLHRFIGFWSCVYLCKYESVFLCVYISCLLVSVHIRISIPLLSVFMLPDKMNAVQVSEYVLCCSCVLVNKFVPLLYPLFSSLHFFPLFLNISIYKYV